MTQQAAGDGGADAPAAGCPVNHGAAPARTLTKAVDLPGSKAPAIVQLVNYWRRPQHFVESRRAKYGPRFQVSIRIPARPVYMLTEPEDVRAMFTAPADVLHTGTGSAVLEKWMGSSGLAFLDEDAHKTRRKEVMPAYHGSALQRLSAAIPLMAKEDVASWPRGKDMALHPHLLRFTLHVIRDVVYGERTPSQWPKLLDLLQQMMEFNNSWASPMMIHKMPERVVKLFRSMKRNGLERFLGLREQANALVYETIREHRESDHRGDDLLSLLLGIRTEDGEPLSDLEVRDEMMTIFLAGTETTAAAMAWTFEYLTRNPEALRTLVAEIDAGESEAYLTAVIHEVLRLRPSIPNIIVREVVKPIEIGGVQFEPGQHLWASAYLVNRDSNTYDEPDAFRPERFLDGKPGTFTWIPFGGGRIRCLGDKVAMAEMKAVIKEVLSQVELVRPDPVHETARSRIVVNIPDKFARVELRDRT